VKTTLEVEADRLGYQLGLASQGAVLRAAPRDNPIPIEEALVAAILANFSPTWKRAVDNLLSGNRLDDLVKLSYNPKKGTFDATYFKQHFERYFDQIWSERMRKVSREVLQDEWDEAIAYSETAYDDIDTETPDFEADEHSTKVFGVMVDLTLVSAMVGATLYVAMPLCQQATFASVMGEKTSAEVHDIFQEALVVRGEDYSLNYFNMLAEVMVTRTRNLARLEAWGQTGAKTAVWKTAEDERVCETCSAMDGKEFSVSGLQKLATKLTSAETREDIIANLPWPSRDGDNFVLPDGQTIGIGASGDELLDLGIGFPPLHGLCRCTLEVVA
jgi:hypothetical protein